MRILVLLAALSLQAVAQSAPATATILEFCDYGNPDCIRLNQLMARVLPLYGDRLRLVFRHLPQTPGAELAHKAALAAEQQGKLDRLHPLLFDAAGAQTRQTLIELASQVGIDPGYFAASLDSSATSLRLQDDIAEASALAIVSAPALFVAGRRLPSGLDERTLRRFLDIALGKAVLDQPADIDTDGAPALGAEGLPEIIVYSDFECPYCARIAPTLKQLADAGQARVIFKHFPLSFHRRAPLAHKAALAAGNQGKFWEMHDRIFAEPTKLERGDLERHAASLALDLSRFLGDLDQPELPLAIRADLKEGETIGVQGTPTIFLNRRQFMGTPTLDGITLALKSLAPAAAEKTLPLHSLYGKDDAPIRLEWFFDAQSPLTAASGQAVRDLIASRPPNLEIIARHRPLEFNQESPLIHEALLLAGEDGKFWEFLESVQAAPEAMNVHRLKVAATRLGLEPEKFGADLDGRRGKPQVDRDMEDARRRNVRGVPSFHLNGRPLEGIPTPSQLAEAIRSEPASLQSTVKGAQP